MLRQLSKQLIERALEAEMTEHLGHDKGGVVINPAGNVRNGSGKKRLQGELGAVELEIPRDRQSRFEPQLVKKHQRRLAGLETTRSVSCRFRLPVPGAAPFVTGTAIPTTTAASATFVLLIYMLGLLNEQRIRPRSNVKRLYPKAHPEEDLQRLLKRVAMERFLARVFHEPASP